MGTTRGSIMRALACLLLLGLAGFAAADAHEDCDICAPDDPMDLEDDCDICKPDDPETADRDECDICSPIIEDSPMTPSTPTQTETKESDPPTETKKFLVEPIVEA